MHQDPLIFCGSSHQDLGYEICKNLTIPLGRMHLGQFPDGETFVEIQERVRGRDVFVLQSIALNPNFYLMELLVIIDALKRASAKNIIVVVPYFGYCRQDRKDKEGVPITAKLVANLLAVAGTTRLMTFDLHAGQLEGFFEIPVDHLQCRELLVDAARKQIGENCTIVAPDIGSVKIGEKIAKLLDTDLAVIEKQRLTELDVKMALIGDVKGKNVLITDDICSTGGTLVAAAELCKQQGARKILAMVTHAICTQEALLKIEKSSLECVMMTNTVPSFNRFKNATKILTVSIAPLIIESIRNHLWDEAPWSTR